MFMTASENVFDEDPGPVSGGGAGARRDDPVVEMAIGSVSDDGAASRLSAVSGASRERWRAGAASASGAVRVPGGGGETPAKLRTGAGELLDPGLLLLPDEVYGDGDSRSRMIRSVRRLWQGETERREAAVDGRLAELSAFAMPRERVLVVCSPRGGSGKTTLALGLAQALASLRWSTLVVDLDLTGGTAGLHARGRATDSGVTLVDVVEAVDAGGVGGPAELAAYLAPLGGGAALLAGPRRREQRRLVEAGQVERLLDVLVRYWPVVIFDTGPGIGDRDRVQEWILRRATDIVAVAVPLRVDALQARGALGELCAMLPATAVTVALNRVPRRPDRATRRVMSVPLAPDRDAHRVELPYDGRLARQLDRAALRLDELGRPTRLAFKELAAAVADGWG
jgi:MinD-like ATPase involved in chromosome partitioning or flagellar assembly